MQFPKYLVSMVLAFPLISGSAWTQEKPEREMEIHKNVKLIHMGVDSTIPEDIVKQYRGFLQILEESLKENTTAQTDECFLTLRVAAGIKEIGAAKTKRPKARLTAFRRNSRQEYVGDLILYSYVNAGPVNKDEVSLFLKRQILEPAECR